MKFVLQPPLHLESVFSSSNRIKYFRSGSNQIWCVQRGDRFMSFRIHSSVVAALSFLLCLSGCQGERDSTVQINPSNYSKTSSEQISNGASNDWARWRGPNGNGIANGSQSPVTNWDLSTNVLWKARVPGRGHASPTIVGDKLFLATADKANESFSILCYDCQNGRLIWEKQVNHGGFRERIHRNNSYASSTISSDGERLFTVFEHHGAIHLYAHDLDGNSIWSKRVGQYQPHYPFGFGGSPLLHGDLVFVPGESDKGSLAAYSRVSGNEVWRLDEDFTSSYTSPIVTTINGQEMLLISGGQQVKALEPTTGNVLWTVAADWYVTCGTMVWDGNMVFASGGYPAQQTVGIDATRGEIIWENGIKCYEQSLLAHDGYIFAVNDKKIAFCWRAKDGKEMWKERLSSNSGGVSASPILANGNIYASVEDGTTFVLKANPKRFELIAVNKLGDSAFASPTIVDSKIYLRVGDEGQEWLYCIGK